ncbi:MoaB/Mog domain-containing protein [Plasmodiophora brassicae]
MQRWASTVARGRIPQAAAVIIGNEVLSGKTKDTNSYYLARTLFDQGVRFARIETIPDLIDDISSTVRRLSSSFDYVFTSGGIGCTHDDITYEAIRQAFGLSLEVHHPTVETMRAYYASRGVKLNSAHMRMATLPYPADKIISTPGLWVPAVQVRNVFTLPGIPSLFESMVKSILAQLDCGTGKFHRLSLNLAVGESEIADCLAEVQSEFPTVEIGSYPKLSQGDPPSYTTQLCFTSRDQQLARDAVAAFESRFKHI